MICELFMKREVESVRPEDSLQIAARRMRDADVGFLPVCDSEGHVLGVITDRDIAVRAVAYGFPESISVTQFMSRDIVACRPTDDVRDAELLMAHAKVSRMLCIDQNSDRLVGVISLSDIAQLEKGSRGASTLREVSERETHP